MSWSIDLYNCCCNHWPRAVLSLSYGRALSVVLLSDWSQYVKVWLSQLVWPSGWSDDGRSDVLYLSGSVSSLGPCP